MTKAKQEDVFRSMDRVENEFFMRPRERRQASEQPESVGEMIAHRIIDSMVKADKVGKSVGRKPRKTQKKAAGSVV